MTTKTADPVVYEPPALVDLGEVRAVTLGGSSYDTADMNKAMYN
ncbi:MAG: lasso RiPP family leader peptide-containing protein [Egibacteraceae bacterium]